MSRKTDKIYSYFKSEYKKKAPKSIEEMRIGSEIKFPFVKEDGTATTMDILNDLWKYLEKRGWKPDLEGANPVGARKPGEKNDTVASVETGHCKPEFSMAHTADLFKMKEQIDELKKELKPFCDKYKVHFLAYGVQPVSRPTGSLMMKKTRASVWDGIFGPNRIIPEEDGDDVCLFTVNAASHVHLSVPGKDMIKAVNVLNGFVGGQLGLMANSNVWKNRLDEKYKCVIDKFWDWWIPEGKRIGIPEVPFRDLRHYVEVISQFSPVYAKRNGNPYLLRKYKTFADYYNQKKADVTMIDGTQMSIVPDTADIDLHNSCYWYNNRISRYFTVENRTNDQQPPADILAISAMTLGLMYALDEAWEELSKYDWKDIVAARDTACEYGLDEAPGSSIQPYDLASSVVEICEMGLKRRDKGEEVFIESLKKRIKERRCPADDIEELFKKDGIGGIIRERSFCYN
jgi:gamma-glutamylcysteine synthetase